MLYLPGLEFSGISASAQFPALASRYELWWCRVGAEDRTTFAELVNAVAEFVENIVVDEETGPRKITILGESFGGTLSFGVAQRLCRNGRNGASALRGIAVVNPATSFDRTELSQIVPLLTSLPADKINIPLPSDGSDNESPALSAYSTAGAAFLALTVPDANQFTRGFRGLLSLLTTQPEVTPLEIHLLIMFAVTRTQARPHSHVPASIRLQLYPHSHSHSRTQS